MTNLQINTPVSMENYTSQKRMRFLEGANRVIGLENCRLSRENAMMRDALCAAIEYLEPRLNSASVKGPQVLRQMSAALIRKE